MRIDRRRKNKVKKIIRTFRKKEKKKK